MSEPSYTEQLSDAYWRLNNLYKIQDENGQVRTFKMNHVQRHLYSRMHYKNLICKARQLGITSLVQLFMLDRCLFNENARAGVIAQGLEAARVFFDVKIKFGYDNLPEDVRRAIPIKSSNKQELQLANGSYIHVDTSHRSGTLQYLHVSEYGVVCAQAPDKAVEIQTGALNTLAPNAICFIESTAMGRSGHFYEMCSLSRQREAQNAQLTPLDYRLHFYAWFWDERYVLDYDVEIPKALQDYFAQLRGDHGIKLSQQQMAWYTKKSEEQGDRMRQEFPSTYEEAFEKTIRGAIWGEAIARMRSEHRILNLPFQSGYPVNTFWDLGRNDSTAIWFHQRIGPWDHFVHFYENRLVDISHYIAHLQELQQTRKFVYGTHYLPHDGAKLTLEAIAGSVADQLRNAGLRVMVVPRTRDIVKSVNDARAAFQHCRMDKEYCDLGITHLEDYVWKFDETNQTYTKTPLHNHASNGADAWRTFAAGYQGERSQVVDYYSARMRGGREPEEVNPDHVKHPGNVPPGVREMPLTEIGPFGSARKTLSGPGYGDIL